MTHEQAYIEGFRQGVRFASDVLAGRSDLGSTAERLEDLKAVREFAERFPGEMLRVTE